MRIRQKQIRDNDNNKSYDNKRSIGIKAKPREERPPSAYDKAEYYNDENFPCDLKDKQISACYQEAYSDTEGEPDDHLSTDPIQEPDECPFFKSDEAPEVTLEDIMQEGCIQKNAIINCYDEALENSNTVHFKAGPNMCSKLDTTQIQDAAPNTKGTSHIKETKDQAISEITTYLIKTEYFMNVGNFLYVYDRDYGYYNKIKDTNFIVFVKDCIKSIKNISSINDYAIKNQMYTNLLSEAPKRLTQGELDKELDNNNAFINFKNCMYSIESRCFLENDPEIIFLYYIDIDIDERLWNTDIFDLKGYRPDHLLDFLRDVTNDNNDTIRIIQEMLGIMLSDIVPKTIFLVKGEPNTGKSVFTNFIRSLFGEFASTIPISELGERFNKAELYMKKVNVSSEFPHSGKKLTNCIDIIKRLTGEDYISAERKGKDPFNFKAKAVQMHCFNEMPIFEGIDEAVIKRMQFIVFDNPVLENEKDYSLPFKLESQKMEAVIWALIGLNRLLENHMIFSTAQKSQNLMEEYCNNIDSVKEFIEERCRVFGKNNPNARNHRVSAVCLYAKYCEFCAEQGLYIINQLGFYKKLRTEYNLICKKIRNLKGATVVEGSGGKDTFYGLAGIEIIK